jgi:hypothetical protein
MAEIIPFRALRYDPHRIPDLAQVMTPPYDVISPEAQDRYYARHPHNVVRLVLAKHVTPDARPQPVREPPRPIRRGGAGSPARPDAAIYLYEQEFSGPDVPPRRRLWRWSGFTSTPSR